MVSEEGGLELTCSESEYLRIRVEVVSKSVKRFTYRRHSDNQVIIWSVRCMRNWVVNTRAIIRSEVQVQTNKPGWLPSCSNKPGWLLSCAGGGLDLGIVGSSHPW